jgi:sialic acid synthase SpsE/mannose-6-phosphate isomerase-like protein (cupin superfamily)
MRNVRLQALTNHNPLLILDMANNHNGSLGHGKRIVDELSQVPGIRDFEVAIKFQYRNLPDFIHADFQNRRDIKYVDRFLSTMLSWDEFFQLKQYIESNGFLTACTPFDEISVDKFIEHDFDILKIASASFADWSLLEACAQWNKSLVASTAGADVVDLDRVVSFFQNRKKDFALMHCVAAYPTLNSDLVLNRIRALRSRYSGLPIGYSTHENPSNFIAGPLALAAGAVILERHIGSSSSGNSLNNYSSEGETLAKWIRALKDSISMLGSVEPFKEVNQSEQAALSGLRRYVYAKRDLPEGVMLSSDDFYFAIPGLDNQLQSKDIGKYDHVVSNVRISKGESITSTNTTRISKGGIVYSIRDNILELLKTSGVIVPNNSTLEISHHYGIDHFFEFGCCMITVVNRDYCKKLIFVLPGQTHPGMFHKQKDETFFLLYGELELKLNHVLTPIVEGDTVSIAPGVIHEFSSQRGAIIEEVSSSHFVDDSFYLDEEITRNKNRKTYVRYWL